MSDTPTSEHKEEVYKIKARMEELASAISSLSFRHDYPDLRHALTKLGSADRGLADFLARK